MEAIKPVWIVILQEVPCKAWLAAISNPKAHGAKDRCKEAKATAQNTLTTIMNVDLNEILPKLKGAKCYDFLIHALIATILYKECEC